MSAFSLILWVLGAFVAMRLLTAAVVLQLYARQRFRHFRHVLLEDLSSVEACAQPLFEHAARDLEKLGFQVAGVAMTEVPFLCNEAPAPTLIMHEPVRQVWAFVVPSGTPTAGAPLSLQLWSYFEDGQSLLTLSGEKFAWIGDSPALRIVDRFRVTWEEQLRDHVAEHARHPRSALALGLEELIARANADADAETLIERLQRSQDPNATTFHRLSWRRVLHLTMQFVRYAGAFNQLQAKRSQLAAWPVPEAAQLWVAARAYRLVDAFQTSFPPRRSLVWTTFGVTGVLFAISMVAYGSFGFIAQLVLVLLVHELGHWLAMRLSGYRDPAIFFIPFFGAAVTGQKADASFRQELTVLVAGPLPGLLREHKLRAWTLHRVERVLDKARQEPDFDPSAADALLAHLRSDEDDGPAKHALEAQLGAAECAAATFVSVGTELHPYQAGFVADPAQLAAHLCAAGCQRLTLVTYE